MPLSGPPPSVGLVPDNIVAPAHPMLVGGNVNTNTANTIIGCRVVVPKSGQLRDLTIYVKTQSGNVIGVVYDTGDTLAGNRTSLWTSGTVAVAAAPAWQTIGDPNIPVTKGQQLDLAFAVDNATASFGRLPALDSATEATLPTGFFAPAGGATGKLGFRISPGSFTVPSPVAEASVVAIASVYFVMARIG